ncbi:MAG: zinc ribbon domain-containing protein [Halobacteriota archaeon]|nr:zinc ribbon domain-containing protein [Halobacteriota archaeon]
MSTEEPNGPFCQSCAMPMQKPEDFGANADGSQNNEYCQYCLKDGKFTEPDISMDQMIEKCAGIMKQMQIPEAKIEQTRQFIPMLKRWQNNMFEW